MGNSLKEYFEEKRLISRGMVLVVALTGAFCGAILMFMMILVGVVS